MKKRLLQVMFLTLFFYFFTFTLPLRAEGINISISMGILLERFNWKEIAPNGKLIIEESSLRKGINMTFDFILKSSNFFGDYTLYSGTVDYDINGDVSYFGTRGEIGIGFLKEITIGYSLVNIMPYLCLASDIWSKKYKYEYEYEYGDEDEEQAWIILFWKIGLRGEIELTFGQLVADLWLGSDIFTMMARNIDDEVAVFEPEGSLFYGTNLTLKYNKFFIRGYYKHYKWNKSPVEKIESYSYDESEKTVYQPESEENDFGIVIGLTFSIEN